MAARINRRIRSVRVRGVINVSAGSDQRSKSTRESTSKINSKSTTLTSPIGNLGEPLDFTNYDIGDENEVQDVDAKASANGGPEPQDEEGVLIADVDTEATGSSSDRRDGSVGGRAIG